MFKKMISRMLFVTLFSVYLLAIATPVRGSLTSDPVIDPVSPVREQSSVIGGQFLVIHKQWTASNGRVSQASSPVAMRNTQAPPPDRNPQLATGNRQQSNSRVVNYTYDHNGRLTSANYGDGVLLVYDYDPSGNLKRVTDHFGIYLPLILRQSN